MAKHLKLNAWENSSPNMGGQQWQIYHTVLDETDFFEDLWAPSYWKHFATGTKQLNEGDIVRIKGSDNSFDIMVSIEERVPGGLNVEYYAGRLPVEYKGLHASEIREVFAKDETQFDVVKMDAAGKPVPRLEHLPATQWRVLGNDNEVVAQDIKSKREADNRFEKYLRDMRLRMPTPIEAAVHKTDMENKAAERVMKANNKKAAA